MMRRIFLAALLALAAALPVTAQTITPQGRLTLTSGTPVMTTGLSAATTIYYACYTGNIVPVGSSPTNLTIGSCNISMGLAAANHLSGSVYDIFGVNNAGTLTLCTGPAWTSTTGRGTGAGTTELTQTNGGLWTNANSMTNCYGGAAGTTNYGAVSANAGTYLGSFYATANGQTEMQFAPTPAAGGTNNFLALYNAYNRVLTRSMSRDSTASWTYNSATWRSANNSASNRITWLDGLQQSSVVASYNVGCQPPVNNACAASVDFDSTSATPAGVVGFGFNANLANNIDDFNFAGGDTTIGLGLHYAQAMEARLVGAGTITYWSASNQRGALTLFMMN